MSSEDEALAISTGRRRYGDVEALVVTWDFHVRGGTFGEEEATAFAQAGADAASSRTPLVAVVRSGGTRLQQGMRALVGIPRAALALGDVAAAGVPVVAVADQPTTGGAWVTVGAHADVIVGVAGATVGFSGPRVVEAMTGVSLPPGANTAESAAKAGLLDDVVPAAGVDDWVTRALAALTGTPATTSPPQRVPPPDPSPLRGWAQVEHCRAAGRADGSDLVRTLLPEGVRLGVADDTAAAAVGQLLGGSAGGPRCVVVALSAQRAGRVSPAGFGLLTRAATLADRLRLPLVSLVDTGGADPMPPSEEAGVARAIATAMTALLRCWTPTVAVVHGEGGSGGALAAATCDLVAVTEHAWFAALAPEGAAAALRRPAAEAADVMRVAPVDLLADGFADSTAPAEAGPLGSWLAGELGQLLAAAPEARLARRNRRWRDPLRGAPPAGTLRPDSD